MKTLVAYYSRTGTTRKVAQALAEKLSADVEELIDTRSRRGPLGFLAACRDAATKKLVPIQPPRKNPADYDLVVGTPVWAGTMCTAVRTYLTECAANIHKAAFFCTTSSSGIEKTNADMRELAGCESLATAGFRHKHVKRDEHIEALNAFIAALALAD